MGGGGRPPREIRGWGGGGGGGVTGGREEVKGLELSELGNKKLVSNFLVKGKCMHEIHENKSKQLFV